LIERDQVFAGKPLEAFSWEREGIPHFLQPHAFIPRGRSELRAAFPDVYRALLDVGAWELDLRPKIRGQLESADEELAYLAARRPLIEWALRQAVLNEPAIRVLSGVNATGYLGERGNPPRVRGVLTPSGTLEADLVVDAMGRRTPGPFWIRGLGGSQLPEQSTECGIIYYSRYYRLRSGATLPEGPWIPTPRADLGYGAFSSFPGDNGTFAAVLAIPPHDRDLKVFRKPKAFTAATSTMPALHSWTNGDIAEPITDVLAMGSLQNTLRSAVVNGKPAAIGVVSVGDAVCHTDPAMALGLAFSMIHARALTQSLFNHPKDVVDAALAFDAWVRPQMEERFSYASALDSQRSRLWAGERVDFARRDGGAYALFTAVAGMSAALVDGDVFRAVVRRYTLLDPLSPLDQNIQLQERIERIFAGLLSQGRPKPGPSRDELLSVIQQAIQTTNQPAATGTQKE
jgi:hypothetical protein